MTFLCFFLNLKGTKGFTNFYVNDIMLPLRIEMTDLKYISFASPKDGVSKEFYFNCKN